MPYYNYNYSDSDSSDDEDNIYKERLYELYNMFISDNEPKNCNHAFYSLRNLINDMQDYIDELEKKKNIQINYITNNQNRIKYKK